MLRGQALSKPIKHTCTLLAVVCGNNRGSSDLQPNEQTAFNEEKQGIWPGNAFSSASTGKDKYLKAGEDRTLDELSDLSTAGRLEVQILVNPTENELRINLETSEPDLVYFQGERVTAKDESRGDVNISTPEAIAGLFGSKMPNLVYLEIPNGGELGEALRAKGVPYVIFWKNNVPCSIASHFRQALLSVFQSSCSQTWDAFQFASASLRLYCAHNKHVTATNRQQAIGRVGPILLGEPPKIAYLQFPKESSEGDGSPLGISTIKIFDEDTDMRFLVCGFPYALDATLLGALEDGLNALLTIEIRGSKLQNRVRPEGCVG